MSYEGELSAKGLKFGIVVSRFNDFITNKLLEGALDALERLGAEEENIAVVRVPGSWEIPVAVKVLAESGDYDAIIALGAVIRGGTAHWQYIASEASKGIASVAMQTGMPVINGILTPDTIEQAVERAGTKQGNKGFQSALAAVEMANLLKKLKG